MRCHPVPPYQKQVWDYLKQGSLFAVLRKQRSIYFCEFQNGHANVGIVDCRNDVEWCSGFSERIVYWKRNLGENGIFYQVKEDTVEGISDAVLQKIPKAKNLSQSELNVSRY